MGYAPSAKKIIENFVAKSCIEDKILQSISFFSFATIVVGTVE